MGPICHWGSGFGFYKNRYTDAYERSQQIFDRFEMSSSELYLFKLIRSNKTMKKLNTFLSNKYSELFFVSIMFLFFLQLFSDFVESIYIFCQPEHKKSMRFIFVNNQIVERNVYDSLTIKTLRF